MITEEILKKLEKIQSLTYDKAKSGDDCMATINNLAHECKRLIINNNLTTDV